MLRIPQCLDNRLTDGSKVVSPTCRQHEEYIINFRKSSLLGSSEFLSWCLTLSDPCRVFAPQLNVAFISSKNCRGFAVSLLLYAPNSFTFELCHVCWCFRLLASLLHNYGIRQIGTSFYFLIAKVWAGFRQDCRSLLRKACFRVPVWLIGPRRSIGFNALRTSIIIQSVALRTSGSSRKEAG
jgi:hypothetical protein